MKIKDFENYWISKEGIVKNLNTNKILKQCINRGYFYVCLSKNGKRHPKMIHRLLAEHFIKNPKRYMIVKHIDGNKQNNSIKNLHWQSKITRNKKSVIQYSMDMKKIKIWNSIYQVSKHLNINPGNISAVCNKQKKHAGGFIWEYSHAKD